MNTDINDITETTYFDDDEAECAVHDDYNTAMSREFPKKTRWFVLVPLVLTAFCFLFAITAVGAHLFWGITTLMMFTVTFFLQGAWGMRRQQLMEQHFPHEVSEGKFSYLVPSPLKPLAIRVLPFMFTDGEKMVNRSIGWKQFGDRMLSRVPGNKKSESEPEEETSYLTAKDGWYDDDDDDDSKAL